MSDELVLARRPSIGASRACELGTTVGEASSVRGSAAAGMATGPTGSDNFRGTPMQAVTDVIAGLRAVAGRRTTQRCDQMDRADTRD